MFRTFVVFLVVIQVFCVFCGKLKYPENEDYKFRSKRFISLYKFYQQDNATILDSTTPVSTDVESPTAPEVIPCFSPDGGPGHCTYISSCFIKSFTAAPLTLYKYFCLMGPSYIGICCPNEEPKIVNKPAELNKDDDIGEENGNNIDTVVFRETPDENDQEARGCGVSNPSQTKIVGGHPALIRQWPWMAALMKGAGSHWERFCGGALITDRHVLTAAHCLTGHENIELRVRLGEYDFSSTTETQIRDFRVVNRRLHSGFSDATMYIDDIAIVKLHRPTTFDDNIWPICLPPVDDMFEDKRATVIGWGTQGYAGPLSDVLLQAEITVWKQGECETTFKRSIPLSTMCAGEHGGRKDSCQGDSGGPLMSQLKSGRWALVGVVSWGIRCGELNRPGLYTRVSQYLEWIVDNSEF